MKPQRIQRKRTKGWKMPPNTISVCRPGYWGNPYKVGGIDNITGEHISTPEHAVLMYRERCLPPLIRSHAKEVLCGKNLACWCRLDQPCHADVLLEIANS